MNFDCKYSSSTAVLLFAQSNKAESAVKPIAYKKKQNYLLWEKLNNKVLQTIQKTQLPYFISSENTQIGSSFGDKLSHAIQTVFDKGYQKVIVVGNDSPGLTVEHLLSSNIRLQDNDWVFGPNCKGGTYLIGVSKTVFNAALFTNISWQTDQVLEQLKTLSVTKSVLLAPLADLNTADDFKKVVKDFSFYNTFKNSLLSIVWYNRPKNQVLKKQYSFEIVGFNFNKGSPLLD